TGGAVLGVVKDRMIGFDRQFFAEVRIEHLLEIMTIHLLHTSIPQWLFSHGHHSRLPKLEMPSSMYFYFETLNPVLLAYPANSFRKGFRPRCSRDITVPIGIPITSAISR